MPPAAKSALKLIAKIFAGLVGILILALGVLLWRLASSPIELDYLTSKVQQVASTLPGGFSLKLKGVELFWNRADRMIDLRAVDVTLIEPSGSSIVTSPEVDISLSVRALMSGVIALSSFDLKDVRVHLLRNEDGSFRISRKQDTTEPNQPAGPAAGESNDITQIVRYYMNALESKPDPQYPLSYLQTIEINGSLGFEDRKTGLGWRADPIDFLFSSSDGGIKGDLSVSLAEPHAFSGTTVDVALNASGDEIDASLQFAGLHAAGFAHFTPGLEALAGVNLTLGGTVSTALTLPDTVHKLEVDIKSSAGQVEHAKFYPQALQISSLELQASADLAEKSLQLKKLDLALGQGGSDWPKLQASGNARLDEHTVSLEIKALLQRLPVDDLAQYWPGDVVNAARNWLVTNLKAGTVDKASLNMAMAIPMDPEGAFQLNELNGALDYSKLTVSYFGSLPVASGVSGSGTYDRHGFDLGIEDGQVNGIGVSKGQVVISGLDENKAAISIKTHLQGELAAAFSVLEAPPFELDQVTGFASAQLEGRIDSEFSIALPLKSGLGKEEISYRAEGKINGGAVQKLFRDFGVQAASLDFNVDQNGIEFKGPLEFAGVPLTLHLDKHPVVDGMTTDIVIKVPKVTAEHIDNLGYPTSHYLQGNMTLDIDAKLGAGGTVEASIISDLTAAQISIPEVHWTKTSGATATASAVFKTTQNHPVNINDIKIDLGTFESRGKATFDLANSQLNADLDYLALDKTRLNELSVTRTEGDGLSLSVQGGELDLEPFLTAGEEPTQPHTGPSTADQTSGPASPVTKGFEFEVESAAFDKVYLSSERYFEDIRFSIRRDQQGWQELSLSGYNPFTTDHIARASQATEERSLKSGQFNLFFGPSADGQFPLHVEAENLGSIFSSLTGKETWSGGYLEIDGNSSGPLLTKPIEVSIELHEFTVTNAPVMAQVLNLASFSQLLTSLNQEGLAFDSLSGDLVLDGTRLKTKLLSMHGGSMGLTATGWVDLGGKTLNFSGAVLPLYKMADFIGKIPVLGKIMVGKDGKGIVAMDYGLEGSFTQPKVSVKPGSLLTPGLLKNIFHSGKEMEEETTHKDSQ